MAVVSEVLSLTRRAQKEHGLMKFRHWWWGFVDETSETFACAALLAVGIVVACFFWVLVVAVLQLAKKHWGLS